MQMVDCYRTIGKLGRIRIHGLHQEEKKSIHSQNDVGVVQLVKCVEEFMPG